MSLSLGPANSCGGGQLLGPHADPSLYLWLTGTSGATVLSASPEWQEGAPPAVEGAEVAPLPAAPAPAQGGHPLTALQLRFQLPPSSYATMAIRQASPNSPLSPDLRGLHLGIHRYAFVASVRRSPCTRLVKSIQDHDFDPVQSIAGRVRANA